MEMTRSMTRYERRAFRSMARRYLLDEGKGVLDAAVAYLATLQGFEDVSQSLRRSVILDLRSRDIGWFAAFPGAPPGIWLVEPAFGLPLAIYDYADALERVRQRDRRP